MIEVVGLDQGVEGTKEASSKCDCLREVTAGQHSRHQEEKMLLKDHAEISPGTCQDIYPFRVNNLVAFT